MLRSPGCATVSPERPKLHASDRRHVLRAGLSPPRRRHQVDETLARAGIFQGVEPAAAEALASTLEAVEFPRGHVVFGEGEPGDRLYIILAGKVKIGRKSPDGRESLLSILGPSDMFGELSIFD